MRGSTILKIAVPVTVATGVGAWFLTRDHDSKDAGTAYGELLARDAKAIGAVPSLSRGQALEITASLAEDRDVDGLVVAREMTRYSEATRTRGADLATLGRISFAWGADAAETHEAVDEYGGVRQFREVMPPPGAKDMTPEIGKLARQHHISLQRAAALWGAGLNQVHDDRKHGMRISWDKVGTGPANRALTRLQRLTGGSREEALALAGASALNKDDTHPISFTPIAARARHFQQLVKAGVSRATAAEIAGDRHWREGGKAALELQRQDIPRAVQPQLTIAALNLATSPDSYYVGSGPAAARAAGTAFQTVLAKTDLTQAQAAELVSRRANQDSPASQW